MISTLDFINFAIFPHLNTNFYENTLGKRGIFKINWIFKIFLKCILTFFDGNDKIIHALWKSTAKQRGIAQLVEQRSPKPRAEGSSPSAPAKYGPVVQLVRTLACHARGRRFDPVPGRQFAAMAQLAEHILGKDEVTRSNRVSSSKKQKP